MSVSMRLTRVGGKKDPVWRVVVADRRSPRDGRVIETAMTGFEPLQARSAFDGRNARSHPLPQPFRCRIENQRRLVLFLGGIRYRQHLQRTGGPREPIALDPVRQAMTQRFAGAKRLPFTQVCPPHLARPERARVETAI